MINEIGSTWYNAVLAKKYFAEVCKKSSEMLVLFLPNHMLIFSFQPNYAEIIHIPESKASLLIGYLSIASTLSRFLFGLVLNHPRVNRFYVLQVCKRCYHGDFKSSRKKKKSMCNELLELHVISLGSLSHWC